MTDQKTGGEVLRLGSVTLAGRAVLAPLSGVTDLAFRRIAKRFGAALVVSEMVASDEFVRGSAEALLRAEGEGLDVHVVQLAGCDPLWMGEAARLAEANGAHIIDINMGCPAKRVTGGYAGSHLMRDLGLATSLIEATVAAVKVPVTVKMRLGWDDGSRNAPELARLAQEIGASAVTVHGRTRQQFYRGRADWAGIRSVVECVSVPVIANGDIGSIDDAEVCLEQSGAAAVMVGRAAMGQPWLVGRIAAGIDGRAYAEPSPEQKTRAAIEHYGDLLDRYGRAVGVKHARKHLAAYADVAAGAGAGLRSPERERLVTSEDPSAVIELLQRLYVSPMRSAA